MARFWSNFRSPAALARFFLTCAIGLALDLSSKVYAAHHLLLEPLASGPDGQVIAISKDYRFIPGWLNFHFTINRGAVFGIGQGERGLFIGVSIVAIIFLSYLFAVSGKQRYYQILLGLLLAGVLGNMYDRVVHGHVRDMIYALPGWQWPASVHRIVPMLPAEVFPWIFNVADSMLCVGVFLLMVYTSWPNRNRGGESIAPADLVDVPGR